MRKLLVLFGLAGVLVVLGMVAVPSTSPAASGGNACPKEDDEREPPNCGKNDNQPNCNENNTGKSPHCPREEEPEPAGPCGENAQVIAISDTTIVCIYLGPGPYQCDDGILLPDPEGQRGAICVLPGQSG